MLGALMALAPLVGQVGKLFGGASKGAADGRMTQAQLQAQQDAIRTSQYGTQQNAETNAGRLDLDRKHFTEDARGGRAKQAMIGDLLSRLQDVSINVPGIKTASVTGGLRPSALGEGGRAAGSLLNQQALQAMLAGDKFTGGSVLRTPGVTAIPKAGAFEKIAGIAGLAGSLGGGILGGLGEMQGGGGGSVPTPGMAQSGLPTDLPGGLDPTILATLAKLGVNPYVDDAADGSNR